MKRLLVLVMLFALLLSGCSQLDSVLDGVQGAISGTLSEEEVYSELSYMIGSPDRDSSVLTSSFTFTALLLDEAEEMEFDEEDDSGVYHMACISRRPDDYFFLEVGDIAETFSPGDMVKVTGELNGWIYWTEDNSQVEILDVKASKVEAYEPPELEVNYTGTITVDGNEYEFLGAHKTEDSFGETIVAYFNFKNNSSGDLSPSLSKFYVEYAGEEVSSTVFGVDEVDPQALSAGGAGIPAKTYAGKTQLYYIAYSTRYIEAAEDEPLYFTIYNDDFQMTDDVGLIVFNTLDELYE